MIVAPNEINYGTHNKYYFKCNKYKEHKSELKNINSFTSGQEGSIQCNQCNSIAQYILDNFPNKDLYEIWDKEKNGDLSPWSIDKRSHKKCWFICQEKDYHGSYESRCSDFSRGHRCSYCSGRKIKHKDSLGQYIIDNFGEEFLWKSWSDKNEMSPFEVAPNSNKKYWWKCVDDKHKDYKRNCNSSIEREFRCPNCSKELKNSIYEDKVKSFIEKLKYEVKTEYDCSLIPINPKTGYPLPFDNEIVLKNGKHLIIEVHGEQHYFIDGYYTKTEEELHKRQLKDRYKRIKCIQEGYEYLEIPYTAFDKKDTYKKLIDDKIKEIVDK